MAQIGTTFPPSIFTPIKTTVTGFEKEVGADNSRFTKYVVKINSGGKNWVVSHRYSEFATLRDELSKSFASVGSFPFPPKTWLSPDDYDIKERRNVLGRFLAQVVELEELVVTSSELRVFLKLDGARDEFSGDESNLDMFLCAKEDVDDLANLLFTRPRTALNSPACSKQNSPRTSVGSLSVEVNTTAEPDGPSDSASQKAAEVDLAEDQSNSESGMEGAEEEPSDTAGEQLGDEKLVEAELGGEAEAQDTEEATTEVEEEAKAASDGSVEEEDSAGSTEASDGETSPLGEVLSDDSSIADPEVVEKMFGNGSQMLNLSENDLIVPPGIAPIVTAPKYSSPLSFHDQERVRGILDAPWNLFAQGVANLLQYPLFIPADMRGKCLETAISQQATPYFVLAACDGLRRLHAWAEEERGSNSFGDKDYYGLTGSVQSDEDDDTRRKFTILHAVAANVGIVARVALNLVMHPPHSRPTLGLHPVHDVCAIMRLLDHTDRETRLLTQNWLLPVSQSMSHDELQSALFKMQVSRRSTLRFQAAMLRYRQHPEEFDNAVGAAKFDEGIPSLRQFKLNEVKRQRMSSLFYSLDASRNGMLGAKTIQEVMQRRGNPKYTIEEAQAAVALVDDDQDGYIDCGEWVALCEMLDVKLHVRSISDVANTASLVNSSRRTNRSKPNLSVDLSAGH